MKGNVLGQGGLKPEDQAKLIPENIKEGVTIDGVVGIVTERKYASGSLSVGADGVVNITSLDFMPNIVVIAKGNSTNWIRIIADRITASLVRGNIYFSSYGWSGVNANSIGLSGGSGTNGIQASIPSVNAPSDYYFNFKSNGFDTKSIQLASSTIQWYAYK